MFSRLRQWLRESWTWIRNRETRLLGLLLVASLLVIIIIGWPRPPEESAVEPVGTFDQLEKQAGEFGIIVAGAARVAPYDSPVQVTLRWQMLDLIHELRARVDEDSPYQVAGFEANLRAMRAAMKIALQIAGGSEDKGDEDKFDRLVDSLLAGTTSASVAPSRMSQDRQKLALLRYLNSQQENLMLGETVPVPQGYRRIVLSLTLTAFLRKETARGAIVYFDLYPAGGDAWAHELGTRIATARADTIGEDPKDKRFVHVSGVPGNSVSARMENEWRRLRDRLVETRVFYDDVVLPKLVLPDTILDPFAIAHRYLMDNELIPRVVHVEPLDEGEYVHHSQLLTFDQAYGIQAQGSPGGVGVGASGEVSQQSARGLRAAGVNLLSLAFAAGEHRAGWVFLPSEVQGAFPPTERRIRMVVDVPSSLRRMAIHVHKQFLDDKLSPIRTAAFGLQITRQNKARAVLSRIESKYPGSRTYSARARVEDVDALSFTTPTNWSLIKSRMRNTLYQTWSEALEVIIPRALPARRPIAVHARIVDEHGAVLGWVVIRDDTIAGVGVAESEIPPGAHRVEYQGGYLYPGLIDAHNHPDYNAIKKWRPRGPYKNRYEWWNNPEYKSTIEAKYNELRTADETYLSFKYGEIRALLGGTTSMQGSRSPAESKLLVRNIGDRYQAGATTDPISLIDEARIREINSGLDTGRFRRFFFHIAEGVDDSSRAEFDTLNAKGLLRKGVVLIHGIALTDTQLNLAAEGKVPVVWSPVSNIRLYGQTLDVCKAIKSGVIVALAPDWTITGSSNLLEEFAEAYQIAVIDSACAKPLDLYRMVTVNAAVACGVDNFLGRVARGFGADLFLAPDLSHDGDPHKNLRLLKPEHIALVLIEGRPVYGDTSQLVPLIGSRAPFDEFTLGGRKKAIVTVGPPSTPRSDERLWEITKRLDDRLHGLAPLVEPISDVDSASRMPGD